MKTFSRALRNVLISVSLVVPATGYSVDFSQRPLAAGSEVKNNVMFILDDSGSMSWEYMPDGISGSLGTRSRNCLSSILFVCISWEYDGSTAYNRWYYSPKENTVFYNPDTTYRPPFKADGTGRYANASFGSARADGYAETGSVNLSREFFHRNRRYSEAFYFRYNQDNSGCDASNPRDNDCYTYVGASSFSAPERQNYANWYSYYRTRMFASRAGIAEAFYALDNSFRLGWGRINSSEQTVDDASDIKAVRQGVRDFSESHREDFLTFLYAAPASGGTPLRSALQGAGKYYENSARAWANRPQESVNPNSNPELECRLSYTILMTDGFWNGESPSLPAEANPDGTDGPTITGPGGQSYSYSKSSPFEDSNSNTLADVAMHYWKRDLRPSLDNFVPRKEVKAVPVRTGDAPYLSPAFWQHMITYGVGLGLPTQQDKDEAFLSMRTGDTISWSTPSDDSINNIDDLLHAGVNGHGGFFSAADPTTFAAELGEVLKDVTASPGSATAAEVTGEIIQEGELIFSASYDPSSWSGDLRAAELGFGGNLVPSFSAAIAAGKGWSAADWLNEETMDPSSRTLITYGDGEGIAFRWDSPLALTQAQVDDLSFGGDANLGRDRLAYIRGDQSQEGAGAARQFRVRNSLLGTIVNSSPNVVGAPSSLWPDRAPFGADGKRYSDFYENKKNRTPVVYAGANDGMLHGFKATVDSGGEELIGYIPSFIFSASASEGLHYLTSPNFNHRYYVDLPTRKQDVYAKGRRANGNPTNSADWRTVLLGGGRAGGKGIFALDVTDPTAFSEANATQLALWEFTSDDDGRLGYITQPPVIAMSEWGGQERWSVFVANGYNSDTQSTGFFILDFEGGLDGNWSGDYQYVEFSSSGKGLSPLTVLDTTGDYKADRVYAGDLDGNVWVAQVNPDGNWGPAYAAPLFIAEESITGGLAVGANREESRAGNLPNLMVYFGTGQYLESDDLADTSKQAFYGVWDRGDSNLGITNLVSRTMTNEVRDVDGAQTEIRVASGSIINFGDHHGWYAELPDTAERVVNNPIVRGDYVYVNSIIPNMDPCAGGGSGWIMAFGRMSGLVADNSKAFERLPDDSQGYRTDGMPSQIVIRGDVLLYDESGEGNPPKVEELPPLSSSVPGAGRRGWIELVE